MNLPYFNYVLLNFQTQSKIKIACLGIFIVLVFFLFIDPITHYVSATIPFERQEITDGLISKGEDYWYDSINSGYIKDSNITNIFKNLSELTAVSYFSDGHTLNTTLWLSAPFITHPLNDNVSYGMMIDSDSDSSTGSGGSDFMFQITWDNNTKTWTYDIEEWGIVKEARVVTLKHNYTDFYGKGGVITTKDDYNDNYVKLNLDSKYITDPENSVITFFVQHEIKKNNQHYKITDYSKWVPIPPPNFVLSISPNAVDVRQGDKKIIPVEIQSTTALVPSITFTTNGIKNLNTSLDPKDIFTPSKGIGSSNFYIYAPNDFKTGTYKIPILAKIVFPAENFKIEGNKPLSIQGISKTQSAYLTLTVNPPLTLSDYLASAWDIWGNPINSFIGLIIAVIAVITGIGGFIFKKSKEKNSNIVSANKNAEEDQTKKE